MMRNRNANALGGDPSLYQRFLREREEILKHKWLESEKAGRDIGFERAILDWARNHRSDWLDSLNGRE